MSNQLTVKKNFIQYGGEFKKNKKEYQELEKKANSLIENSTQKEKKALEEAFNAYQKKIESVVTSKQYKTLENKAKNHSVAMNKTLIKAKNEFIKITDQINKKDWDESIKKKKINELYDYVISKFYSKEEIEGFKKMMSSIVLLNT